MTSDKPWYDKLLDAGIQASVAALLALFVSLILKGLWEEYSADIKAYTSAQWQAFTRTQSKSQFIQWCQKVVKGLGMNGHNWAQGKSTVLTEVDRDGQTARTFFQVSKTDTFASEEYVLLDGQSNDSFLRATGNVIEMGELMKKYYVHEGVV